jgi:hypothetical protein
VDIASIAQKYTNVYQDITNVFEQADLPRMFTGEVTQEMTSCWLGPILLKLQTVWCMCLPKLYTLAADTHLTEKTFKAIALEMPFVLVAPAGSFEPTCVSYGFKTFDQRVR